MHQSIQQECKKTGTEKKGHGTIQKSEQMGQSKTILVYLQTIADLGSSTKEEDLDQTCSSEATLVQVVQYIDPNGWRQEKY